MKLDKSLMVKSCLGLLAAMLVLGIFLPYKIGWVYVASVLSEDDLSIIDRGRSKVVDIYQQSEFDQRYRLHRQNYTLEIEVGESYRPSLSIVAIEPDGMGSLIVDHNISYDDEDSFLVAKTLASSGGCGWFGVHDNHSASRAIFITGNCQNFVDRSQLQLSFKVKSRSGIIVGQEELTVRIQRNGFYAILDLP